MKVKLLKAIIVNAESLDTGSVVEVSERDGRFLTASGAAEKSKANLKKIKPGTKAKSDDKPAEK